MGFFELVLSPFCHVGPSHHWAPICSPPGAAGSLARRIIDSKRSTQHTKEARILRRTMIFHCMRNTAHVYKLYRAYGSKQQICAWLGMLQVCERVGLSCFAFPFFLLFFRKGDTRRCAALVDEQHTSTQYRRLLAQRQKKSETGNGKLRRDRKEVKGAAFDPIRSSFAHHPFKSARPRQTTNESSWRTKRARRKGGDTTMRG